jgi:hypothetical protein
MDASPFLRRGNEGSHDRAREFGVVCRHGLRPDILVAPAAVREGAVLNTRDGGPAAAHARASLDEACRDVNAAEAALTLDLADAERQASRA